MCKLRPPGIIMGHLSFVFASTMFCTPLHLLHGRIFIVNIRKMLICQPSGNVIFLCISKERKRERETKKQTMKNSNRFSLLFFFSLVYGHSLNMYHFIRLNYYYYRLSVIIHNNGKVTMIKMKRMIAFYLNRFIVFTILKRK